MARLDETKSTERIFSILHFFKANTILSYDQLAQLLNESPEQARHDIEMFSSYEIDNEILYFIFLEEDELPPCGGIYIMDDLPALERPLRLSSSETAALAAALEFAESGVTSNLKQKLLTSRATPVDWNHVSFTGADVDQNILESLALFCEKRHCAIITYCKEGATEGQERYIEPLRLHLSQQGEWYLDAFCQERQAQRTFKVSRIQKVEDATGHWKPRDLDPMAVHLDDSPLALLQLPLSTPLDERDWPGLVVVSQDEENQTQVISLPYDGLTWITRKIVARLGKIQVLEPPELAQSVADFAANMLIKL